MTTTHYYYDSNDQKILESDFQKICHNIAKKHGAYLRIIESGAGAVILPDTDRTHDCGPSELAKALRLKEEMEKPSTTETHQNIIITEEDDNRNYFVKLTEEQYRLLDWLYSNGLLGMYVKFERPTDFETI